MGADLSRVRFDPLRDFAGVVLQQGRLLLDGDFNEYVALLDRRLRAETVDLTSYGPNPDRAGSAWVPRQTPDAFRVTASGGTLSIGRGRMYVDGLVAENHGGAPPGFDPLLAERTGTAETAYDAQPYWPVPDPLPDGVGPHLAYLDVWQREVTSLEDPNLVEIAVGVDTTARWQTVWQVRLLPDVGDTSCATADEDIPGWLDVITPSAGRLSTGTVPIDPVDDPCALPPTGGYRGLENQTYRVEIRTGGAPGSATFTWSRDNASVALPVVEMVSPTVLRLASVGKDDVLRVSTGDWVEILDDAYELGGRAGELRKVTVDDAARTVTFGDALPADLQPVDAADAAARHLRLRRWDESGVVRDATGADLVDLDAAGATGDIPVPADHTTQIVLEHGVVVSFSLAEDGGRFRAGDHWVFVARTADTSVETLVEAPPLGVHHHYARLGVVTFPDAATDCRTLWPPVSTGGGDCGDCSVCVTPESHSTGVLTIQAAVDSVREAGGTVCLAVGVYDVGDGVTVDAARSVTIRGQGPATIVVGRGTALTINRSTAVTVERLAVVGGTAAPAAVRLNTVADTELRDLVVLALGFGRRDDANRADIGAAVQLSGVALVVSLRRNILVGRAGVDAGVGDGVGVFAAGLRVEDNVVVGGNRGIDLGGLSVYLYACRVSANEVLAGDGGGIVATGAVAPGGSLSVAGNTVATSGTGIAVGADALVDSNAVNALSVRGDGAGGDGIVVVAGGIAVPPGDVRVTGNRVHGRSGTGIALRTGVRTWLVKQNVLSDCLAGIAIEDKGAASHVSIENNELLDIATKGETGNSAAGIFVTHADFAAVSDNTVWRVAPDLVDGRLRAGIAVVASADVRISGNVVTEVGPRDGFAGTAAGVVVLGPFERLALLGNSIRLPDGAQPPQQGDWQAIVVQSAGTGLMRVGRGKAVINTDSGPVVVTGTWAYAAAFRGDHVTLSSNTFEGGGAQPACAVRVGGDVVADANSCTYRSPQQEPVAMRLEASSVTASTNRLRGDRAMLVVFTDENRFAVLGNLASGGTHLRSPGGGLPGPWDSFNPMVP